MGVPLEQPQVDLVLVIWSEQVLLGLDALVLAEHPATWPGQAQMQLVVVVSEAVQPQVALALVGASLALTALGLWAVFLPEVEHFPKVEGVA